jgi:hypothetical protein
LMIDGSVRMSFGGFGGIDDILILVVWFRFFVGAAEVPQIYFLKLQWYLIESYYFIEFHWFCIWRPWVSREKHLSSVLPSFSQNLQYFFTNLFCLWFAVFSLCPFWFFNARNFIKHLWTVWPGFLQLGHFIGPLFLFGCCWEWLLFWFPHFLL